MEIAVAAVAVFLGQFVRGVTGFGHNMVAIPIMLLVWPAREALFVASCVAVIAAMIRRGREAI